MNTCETCHEPHRGRRSECSPCRRYREWYASLTPAERRRDEESIAAYVAEHEQDPT